MLTLKLIEYLIPALRFEKISAPVVAENLLGLEILYGMFVDGIGIHTNDLLMYRVGSVIDGHLDHMGVFTYLDGSTIVLDPSTVPITEWFAHLLLCLLSICITEMS